MTTIVAASHELTEVDRKAISQAIAEQVAAGLRMPDKIEVPATGRPRATMYFRYIAGAEGWHAVLGQPTVQAWIRARHGQQIRRADGMLHYAPGLAASITVLEIRVGGAS